MPLDQVVFPEMPELYCAAVRALQYCEPSSERSSQHSAGVLRDVGRPKLSQRKEFQWRQRFSSWLRSLVRYLAVVPTH